jgi:hypothetical protein
MALLTTGTASIMTLVFNGTVAVGSLMVEKVARTQPGVTDRPLTHGAVYHRVLRKALSVVAVPTLEQEQNRALIRYHRQIMAGQALMRGI